MSIEQSVYIIPNSIPATEASVYIAPVARPKGAKQIPEEKSVNPLDMVQEYETKERFRLNEEYKELITPAALAGEDKGISRINYKVLEHGAGSSCVAVIAIVINR